MLGEFQSMASHRPRYAHSARLGIS